MQRLVIEVDDGAFARLVRRARRERRPTRDEAAVLLERVLSVGEPMADRGGDADSGDEASR